MVTRVREMLERSRRSLLEGPTRQRWEGPARQLLERSRATVANLVGTPPSNPAASQDVLSGVCSSLSLRDLNLVDSLLEQLEKMESDEDDPDTLAQLYKLDHLATRLRRNAENLRVLAGREAGGGAEATASLVDVIRAGMSSIEHYPRVQLGRIATLGVVGFAADDVSRMLAELLDNATTHSPPSSQVSVSAHLTEQGSVMVRIEDAGIGLPAARLSALNERLASAPVLDRNAVQHMGLAVVRRLARRHGVRVWLARRAPHGTTASVLLPPALVHEAPAAASTTTRRTPPAAEQSTPDESTDAPLPRRTRTQRSTNGSGYIVEGAPHRKGTVFIDPSTLDNGEQQGSTTANGLPRRVPRSLKEAAPAWPPATPDDAERTVEEVHQGHEQLLDDLGAFAEGEQAAQQDRQPRDDQNSPEGNEK